MKDFVEGRGSPIMVTTDYLSGGVNFQTLSIVISYDTAVKPYLHVNRIGRTSRCGQLSLALCIVCSDREKACMENVARMCHLGYTVYKPGMKLDFHKMHT